MRRRVRDTAVHRPRGAIVARFITTVISREPLTPWRLRPRLPLPLRRTRAILADVIASDRPTVASHVPIIAAIPDTHLPQLQRWTVVLVAVTLRDRRSTVMGDRPAVIATRGTIVADIPADRPQLQGWLVPIGTRRETTVAAIQWARRPRLLWRCGMRRSTRPPERSRHPRPALHRGAAVCIAHQLHARAARRLRHHRPARRARIDPVLDPRAVGRHQRAIDERECLIHGDARRGARAARSLAGHRGIVARPRWRVNSQHPPGPRRRDFRAPRSYHPRSMAPDDPVADAWQHCRDERPGVTATLAQFRAHLAAHRPAELPEAEQLTTWCLDDIYLVAACIAGDPAAVRAIEAEIIPIIDLALIGWDRTVIDETRQQLRTQLIVDHAGRGPLLAQYGGRGALRRWIRVVAAREAGKIRARDTAALPADDDVLFNAIAPSSDPALSTVKNDAAAAFRAAFVATLGELDRRERTVLRLHVLDGLTIDEIAPMYEVHRATVARWIASAKHTVLERTRRRLMHDLRLDATEVDSLIRLVQSRIELAEDPLRTG
ncbi:MAG: hypothetical protein E6J90_08365 [Deltaproteobacteria bacterium]|nr:MAG: hypothetical protein E6J90_08365 [Deltaproteobacteria bacterium]